MDLVGQVIRTRKIGYFNRAGYPVGRRVPITSIDLILTQKVKDKFKNIHRVFTFFDSSAVETKYLESGSFIKVSGIQFRDYRLESHNRMSHGTARHFDLITQEQFLGLKEQCSIR